LATKYEKSTQMALGALAFRASMEEKRGRVKRGDLKKSLKDTENREGTNALEQGIEIVGESFYSSNFNHIRRQLSIDGGSEKVLRGIPPNEPRTLEAIPRSSRNLQTSTVLSHYQSTYHRSRRLGAWAHHRGLLHTGCNTGPHGRQLKVHIRRAMASG
jgi:hypothetical protein